jgi:hypothetical protein
MKYYPFLTAANSKNINNKIANLTKHADIIRRIEDVIVVFASTILNAWVLTLLWKWFIVKPFNLPLLTLPMAYGMILVVQYLTSNINANTVYLQWLEIKKRMEDEDGYKISYTLNHIKTAIMIAKPVMFLIAGWITQAIFM